MPMLSLLASAARNLLRKRGKSSRRARSSAPVKKRRNYDVVDHAILREVLAMEGLKSLGEEQIRSTISAGVAQMAQGTAGERVHFGSADQNRIWTQYYSRIKWD
jgi:hypothetical protein